MIRNLKVGRLVGKHAVALTIAMLASAGAQQMQAPVGQDKASGSPYAGRQDMLMHSGSQAPVEEDISKLPLAAGFLVGLNVLDEPDLFGSFRVDQLGNLNLPVLGTVHVAGMSAPEASDLIRKKLLEGEFLKNPQVNLSVMEYIAPQVTILGEVVSPGKYPLLAPHPLVQVLAQAGGLNATAGNEVEIQRADTKAATPQVVEYSRDSASETVSQVMIAPGDTVRVRRAGIVYVLGAVMRPGGYVMQEGGTLSVIEAISLASGTSPMADMSKLHILRPNDDGSVMDIPLSYKRLMEGKTAPVLLQAKDVVYVPNSRIKSAFASSSSILSSAASASIYAVH